MRSMRRCCSSSALRYSSASFLALADAAGHEVARFPKALHNGLALAAAIFAVNQAISQVDVLILGQPHVLRCLVDQSPDFCGYFPHTVSPSSIL